MRSLSSSIPVTVLSIALAALLIAPLVTAQVNGAYFSISEPAAGRQWANGVANPVQWTKGLLDGVQTFDIELARMNKDGILYVARNVPAKSGSMNVYLQDVPPADDYFMLFINSTHGVMYNISPRFTIVDSQSASGSGSLGTPISSAPTITLSGGPNPTATFATMYASNGGVPLGWVGMGGWMTCLVTMVCSMTAGAFMVFV